jgi:hypothetical protein
MLTVRRRLLLLQLRGRMPHQAVSDLPGVAFTLAADNLQSHVHGHCERSSGLLNVIVLEYVISLG